MWGHADTTTSHNRGAVADPAEWLMIHMAGDVIRVLCGRFFWVALYPWVTLSLTHG